MFMIIAFGNDCRCFMLDDQAGWTKFMVELAEAGYDYKVLVQP